jgi:pentatricopeptide repeat protein
MVFAKLFEAKQKKAAASTKEQKQSPSKEAASQIAQAKQKKSPNKPKADQSNGARKRGGTSAADDKGSLKRRRKSDDDPTHRQRRPATGKKVKPSPQTLALSRELQDLSRQKRLKEALALYWRKDGAVPRDEHHACIVVDCCARSGSVKEAEKIVQDLRTRLPKINVTTQTALLKGYAHAGQMPKAVAVFREMCAEEETWDQPNVRTLNTLLRGCLWTAAAKDEATGEIVGGVVTSEEAWQLFKDRVGQDVMDSSSYETSIILLCQALRTREAEQRIAEFQTRHSVRVKGKASISGGDETVLETLAVNYLALARAHALSARLDDMWTACQRVLSAVKASRALWEAIQKQASDNNGPKKHGVEGGKRAWKNTSNDGDAEKDSRRAVSNIAYRSHRLSELETEAKELLKIRGKQTVTLSTKDLAQRVLQRLFYFSGGGTTDLAATGCNADETTGNLEMDLFTPNWMSFGLSQLVGDESDATAMDMLGKDDNGDVWKDGLDFDKLFSSKKKPVHVELGAGFGDWIVRQAQNDPSRNYVAVELRADRVFQIFSKATLASPKPLDNVAVVGSECGSFLRDRIKKRSISTVFANFPEPPTQSYGENAGELQAIMSGGVEPAHMLNSATLTTAAACLKSNGKIVIVTDNRWYARLLCATFVKVGLDYNGLVSSTPEATKNSGLRQSESFADPQSKAKSPVILYEGLPSEAIGHVKTTNAGDSYFDRLWRTGAGSHSERRTRFVIVMNRC